MASIVIDYLHSFGYKCVPDIHRHCYRIWRTNGLFHMLLYIYDDYVYYYTNTDHDEYSEKLKVRLYYSSPTFLDDLRQAVVGYR